MCCSSKDYMCCLSTYSETLRHACLVTGSICGLPGPLGTINLQLPVLDKALHLLMLLLQHLLQVCTLRPQAQCLLGQVQHHLQMACRQDLLAPRTWSQDTALADTAPPSQSTQTELHAQKVCPVR